MVVIDVIILKGHGCAATEGSLNQGFHYEQNHAGHAGEFGVPMIPEAYLAIDEEASSTEALLERQRRHDDVQIVYNGG